MDTQYVEALLVCSRANVGYLADYTYHTAQALPFCSRTDASGA